MNLHAVKAIYKFEMTRMWRTIGQTIASPVLTTCLYFIVFGSAIGNQINEINGVPYGAFIVPGLMMMSILTQSISNASFGIYFPRFTGTIFEVLSAPISTIEIVLGYVGAAATKALMIGGLILITAIFFVDFQIMYPITMIILLIITAFTFSCMGFLIGIWADGFEKLQLVPLLIVTPLAFLGGSFYSITMLPPIWQAISMLNPVVYLISIFRWSFYGGSTDVSLTLSISMIIVFIVLFLSLIGWVFKTGYGLKR